MNQIKKQIRTPIDQVWFQGIKANLETQVWMQVGEQILTLCNEFDHLKNIQTNVGLNRLDNSKDYISD